jgi:phosphatidylglycerol lysyltransferase
MSAARESNSPVFHHLLRRVWALGSRFATPIWIVLLAASVGVFVMRHGAEATRGLGALTQSDPRWASVVIAAQLGIIVLITQKYRTLFARIGVRVPPGTMARAYVRRHFIAVVLPFGGPVGIAQFVRDLGRHRIRGGTVLTGSFMATLVNELSFFLYMIPTFAWLALAGRVTHAMLIGLIALGVVVGAVLTTLLVVLFRGTVPAWLDGRIPARIADGIADISAHRIGIRDIAPGIPYALGVNIAGLLMLAASVQAVGQHPSLTTLLVARAGASLAMLALPIFQGAGAVEVTVIGALHAGGVPIPDAIAATVLFRIGQFWAPLAIGGAAILPWERCDLRAWRLYPRTVPQIAATVAAMALLLAPIGLLLSGVDVT